MYIYIYLGLTRICICIQPYELLYTYTDTDLFRYIYGPEFSARLFRMTYQARGMCTLKRSPSGALLEQSSGCRV